MAKFRILKEPLQPHFLGLNIESVGIAAGKLKPCGLKLYLYLMSNSDGFIWNMNPAAFAKWLGLDYSNASEARKARKAVSDGIIDLKESGYLIEEDDEYAISEQFVPEWIENKVGINCSKKVLDS